ncbi:MAG: hypothetical protein KC877_05020 [Candidatus Kaiserbacteria bacterium]|nr:hypothetical protein [Candidatus Kaiserbacteria bacterium]MCB9816723.1 hypothetical protein [Candidatus Nomurabacteria bacterium]
MVHGIVILFLVLATAFAAAHAAAVFASLYWYYWWFDVVMHFWGGTLIALGLFSLSTFSRLHFKPTLPLLLATLLVVTLSWEAFELAAGLWQPATYLVDTVQDIVIGFSGGLLAYAVLRRYTIN